MKAFSTLFLDLESKGWYLVLFEFRFNEKILFVGFEKESPNYQDSLDTLRATTYIELNGRTPGVIES